MARPESIALGGFYKTPSELIPQIAARLEKPEIPKYGSGKVFSFADPCAGEGEALNLLLACLALCGRATAYVCEMEETRAAAIRDADHWRSNYIDREQHVLCGDAFNVVYAGAGVSALYLNPPYDADRQFKRLEERFLQRFWRVLKVGGVLVFLVPHYALAASAATLGRHFSDVGCYRFPGAHFDAFRQVVLFATRSDCSLPEPDPRVVALCERWAADAGSIPELPDEEAEEHRWSLPETHVALTSWKMATVDVAGLVARFKPWTETTRTMVDRPVQAILPALPLGELLNRRYDVAVPPRPAHIAAGLAAGIFNGQRIDPDEPGSKLPPMLVKGVFVREWKTVEEKENKDGDKTGEVQVQQPKLVVSVLDLDRHRYLTILPGLERTGGADVADFTLADLLHHYGKSLGGVMERQCIIGYDPRIESGPLPPSPRALFKAQQHAASALVRLLGGPGVRRKDRRGRCGILLGEIGVGKTTVAQMVSRACDARKVLVFCPPHLLDGWTDEVGKVWPEARVEVLRSVADVDRVAADRGARPIVAVLSRETAKLGHGIGPAGAVCPKCGASAPDGDAQVRRRLRCESQETKPANEIARCVVRFALTLRPHLPGEPLLRSVLTGRLDRQRFKDLTEAGGEAPEWPGLPEEFVLRAIAALTRRKLAGENPEAVMKAIVLLYGADPDERWLVLAIRMIASSDDYRRFAAGLLHLLPRNAKVRRELAEEIRLIERKRFTHYAPNYTESDRWKEHEETLANPSKSVKVGDVPVNWQDGVLYVGGVQADTAEAGMKALSAIYNMARWKVGPECGEPLFAAVPEPRRFPLATYIAKRHRYAFDFLILDEAHEAATDGSAQERAAHRLIGLGLPTVLMTGTVMNGYAKSLFTNMWHASPRFREEFDRDAMSAFVDRYGYRKRFVAERDGKAAEVKQRGATTDRVETTEKNIGDAPGVLPLFLFWHLLPYAVTVQKRDLALELPACDLRRVSVSASDEQMSHYNYLLDELLDAIRRDKRTKLNGKLFGALSELPSYLDRATVDVGNCEDGCYRVAYPESVGGKVVASAPPFPASTVLPKEQAMLDELESQLRRDRNVMVFGWHVSLLPRLAKLCEKVVGGTVPILFADKVPTGKRQAWIQREVVDKGRRVLVANPVAIQTGLNNLVHFSTEWWHQNPACNPITYRQAIGRVDRIGQKKPTEILFPVYEDTLQVQLYDLLLSKVAISTATDGLDPEAALAAAGVDDSNYIAGLSVGKALYEALTKAGR